jgi:hypothetical protein
LIELARLFGQADTEREQPWHTWVYDAVMDAIAVAARRDDAAINEAAELIGDGLGRHLYRRS